MSNICITIKALWIMGDKHYISYKGWDDTTFLFFTFLFFFFLSFFFVMVMSRLETGDKKGYNFGECYHHTLSWHGIWNSINRVLLYHERCFYRFSVFYSALTLMGVEGSIFYKVWLDQNCGTQGEAGNGLTRRKRRA
ncbi:hypothetical protein ACMFMF_010920 [Clarireedia jacksonii]